MISEVKKSRLTVYPSGETDIRVAASEKKYTARMKDIALFSVEIAQSHNKILTGRFKHGKDKSHITLFIGKRYVGAVDSDGNFNLRDKNENTPRL